VHLFLSSSRARYFSWSGQYFYAAGGAVDRVCANLLLIPVGRRKTFLHCRAASGFIIPFALASPASLYLGPFI